ncbi:MULTISPECIES: bifunctional phosphoglucose/phosphomannose isomerase [unclassified Aureispira]|uniref:bifunctional phosphoglucose/phosphomannose isomerase n=1 Tax=unclassified Aureispira TaxID=2649989 RepID=UPI00069727FF|nr:MULTISPECIES: bifunctional phosphoglucose/phosphomannose isomerase [unclassified Aureispira]WMX12809.1 bifunctional phosphoglucose/phosphomannose isomerase [Aureispira sp. CCB-E]
MMNVFIQEFPKQLKTALEIGEQATLSKHNQPIQNIVVLGMGGSGIGGEFVAEFVKDTCSVPFLSCKGYNIPAYVGKNTLVITSSFSGNTEETLNAFEEALKREAKIVCISSGGKLIEEAKRLNLDYIKIPSVQQPPRTCLGYSLVQQLFVLNYFGFASKQCIQDIKSSIALLEEQQDQIRVKAAQLARKMEGKFPVIYATDKMGAVTLRLRQQLNENSKILALNHVFPEMNHNELVGWREQIGQYVVLIFRSKDDLARNNKRIEISKDIIEKIADELLEIDCLGDSLIEQAMYAVHLGDWISWELAEARKMDSIEVNVIDLLKRELAAAALG